MVVILSVQNQRFLGFMRTSNVNSKRSRSSAQQGKLILAFYRCIPSVMSFINMLLSSASWSLGLKSDHLSGWSHGDQTSWPVTIGLLLDFSILKGGFVLRHGSPTRYMAPKSLKPSLCPQRR